MCRFCTIFGRFGGAWPRLVPLDPALKVMAPRPRLIGICVYLLNLKDDVCTDYFQKVHANALHRNLIALEQRNFALATVIPKQLALFQAAILLKKLAKLAHAVILTLRRNSSFLPDCQSRLD